MSDKELPYQLMAWIKREQAKDEAHKATMVVKNKSDDELYERMLQTLVKLGLKQKDRIFVLSLVRHKSEGKNYSPNQRSAITGLFYKYVA